MDLPAPGTARILVYLIIYQRIFLSAGASAVISRLAHVKEKTKRRPIPSSCIPYSRTETFYEGSSQSDRLVENKNRTQQQQQKSQARQKSKIRGSFQSHHPLLVNSQFFVEKLNSLKTMDLVKDKLQAFRATLDQIPALQKAEVRDHGSYMRRHECASIVDERLVDVEGDGRKRNCSFLLS